MLDENSFSCQEVSASACTRCVGESGGGRGKMGRPGERGRESPFKFKICCQARSAARGGRAAALGRRFEIAGESKGRRGPTDADAC